MMNKTFLLSSMVACLATPAAAQTAALAPAEIVRQMAGCFQVTFSYVEDGAHDSEFPPVYEKAVVSSEAPLTISRTLILGTFAQPHWSEAWSEVEDGKWQQTVTGPYGDFRYSCSARWELNQWTCEAKGAAKPRRDTARPYATLDRLNTIQINDKGWVQAETNRKLTASGELYGIELGWNRYRRTTDEHCQVVPKAPASVDLNE